MISLEGMKNYLVLNVPQLKEQISNIKNYTDLEKFLETQLNKAMDEFKMAAAKSTVIEPKAATATEEVMTDHDYNLYDRLKRGYVFRHISWPSDWCIFMYQEKMLDRNCVNIHSFPKGLDPKGWICIGGTFLANSLFQKSYRTTTVTKTATTSVTEEEKPNTTDSQKKYSNPTIDNTPRKFIKYGTEKQEEAQKELDSKYLHQMYLQGYVGKVYETVLKHKASIAYALGIKSQAEKRNILSVSELNEMVESLLK